MTTRDHGSRVASLFRSANELIKQFGDATDIEAAMRADERLAAGDVEGEAVWLRIGKAVEELLSEERPGDAEVHWGPLIGAVALTQYAAASRTDPARRGPRGTAGARPSCGPLQD